MGTKLEECARVLCKAAGKNPDYVWTDGKPEWTMYVDNARAVIRCLMEPDEAMMDAGTDCDNVDGNAPAGMHFVAMLQIVLDEAGEE